MSRRASVRLAAAVAALARAVSSDPATASDYGPLGEGWNELGQLTELARQQGCRVVPSDRLDWTDVADDDAIWLIYPTVAPSPARVIEHLARGGTVLLADDFGALDSTFRRLGLERATVGLDGVDHLGELGHLPVARPGHRTALGTSTETLVANHPAWFSASPVPPTFAFRPDAGLVVEGHLGRGSFVALADPSVLINNMLELDSNRAFAEALTATSCVPGRRVLVVTGRFEEIGGGTRPRSGPVSLAELGARLNDVIAGLPSGRPVTLGLLAVALLVFGTLAPRARRPSTPLPALPSRDEAGLDPASLGALLRTELVARYAAAVPEVDVHSAGVERIRAALHARYGPARTRALIALWNDICRLLGAPGDQLPSRLPARALRRLVARSRSVLDDPSNEGAKSA